MADSGYACPDIVFAGSGYVRLDYGIGLAVDAAISDYNIGLKEMATHLARLLR